MTAAPLGLRPIGAADRLREYFEERSRFRMPISVEVHHALMDGVHVGRYFDQPAALVGQDL